MKVFKFGGASIRDAASIKNMAGIVLAHSDEPLLVVVSAMGKTTNAFEEALALREDQSACDVKLQSTESYHLDIADELLGDHPVSQTISEIIQNARTNLSASLPYDELYDQVVSCGELLSSRLIHACLLHQGVAVSWVDARKCILTDDRFREGQVHWELTHAAVHEQLPSLLENGVILTQGFIGGTRDGRTTTLGREGSDFTAAILASCLKASSVTVWKDVDGIMNADPKQIENTVKFDFLPYREAAEMTYYGASVIHPKTIKPLANDRIPLFVRSFYHPDKPGTVIQDMESYQPIPAIILKDSQCLVSFYVRDFTFVNEQNLSLIFHQLAEMGMKINMMQNSAISFSICVDYDEKKLSELRERLKGHFKIKFNTGLILVTVKHYTSAYLDEYRSRNKVLLEQTSRNTFQILIEP